VQETLQRSTKQKEDLGHTKHSPKKQKEADATEEDIKHQAYTPHPPIFQSLLISPKALVHLFLKHFFQFIE
jgi:hypothetical protein